MPENFNGIQIIHGLTDIFVIAPHGPVVNGKPRNDLNTGKIAEMIHAELGFTGQVSFLEFRICNAIISITDHKLLTLEDIMFYYS